MKHKSTVQYLKNREDRARPATAGCIGWRVMFKFEQLHACTDIAVSPGGIYEAAMQHILLVCIWIARSTVA